MYCITEDVEVSRLVKELDSAVDAIPQLGVTFNLQTEIDLAIQPLRSENSQLRRSASSLNFTICLSRFTKEVLDA